MRRFMMQRLLRIGLVIGITTSLAYFYFVYNLPTDDNKIEVNVRNSPEKVNAEKVKNPVEFKPKATHKDDTGDTDDIDFDKNDQHSSNGLLKEPAEEPQQLKEPNEPHFHSNDAVNIPTIKVEKVDIPVEADVDPKENINNDAEEKDVKPELSNIPQKPMVEEIPQQKPNLENKNVEQVEVIEEVLVFEDAQKSPKDVNVYKEGEESDEGKGVLMGQEGVVVGQEKVLLGQKELHDIAEDAEQFGDPKFDQSADLNIAEDMKQSDNVNEANPVQPKQDIKVSNQNLDGKDQESNKIQANPADPAQKQQLKTSDQVDNKNAEKETDQESNKIRAKPADPPQQQQLKTSDQVDDQDAEKEKDQESNKIRAKPADLPQQQQLKTSDQVDNQQAEKEKKQRSDKIPTKEQDSKRQDTQHDKVEEKPPKEAKQDPPQNEAPIDAVDKKEKLPVDTRKPSERDTMHLAVVSCGERVRDTLVMIKSACTVSEKRVHVHIFADDDNRPKYQKELSSWKFVESGKLLFTIYPITYPRGEKNDWIKLFRPCATQRLFLPDVLPNIELILYVDTDILFLQSMDSIWRFFDDFNATHIAALAPEHEDPHVGWYNRFARHPYYPPLGLNSGVMLMNLSRMREVKFVDEMPPYLKKYKYSITWGDQDLLNIYFHFYPEKLLVYPCQWNYRPDHCMYMSVCKTAEQDGAQVLHGCRGVFMNEKQPMFRAVFEAFEDHKVEDGLGALVDSFKTKIDAAKASNCGRVRHIFTKVLEGRKKL